MFTFVHKKGANDWQIDEPAGENIMDPLSVHTTKYKMSHTFSRRKKTIKHKVHGIKNFHIQFRVFFYCVCVIVLHFTESIT